MLTQHNRRRNTYITTIKHKQTDRLFFIYLSLTPSSSLPFQKEKISSFKIITDRRTKLILISPSPQAPPSLYYILFPLEEGKNFSKIFPFFKRDHPHTLHGARTMHGPTLGVQQKCQPSNQHQALFPTTNQRREHTFIT